MYSEVIKNKIDNIDYSAFGDKKIAISITAYDRVEYVKDVLVGISRNKISSEIPVFLFIDGGPKSEAKKILDCFKEFKGIKNKFASVRNGNIGCSANIINAREELFMDYQFDSVIVIEDDLVIADNYLEHIIEANRVLTSKYKNIGMIQGWNPKGDDKSLDPNSFEVLEDAHLWGYIMNRNVWVDIRQDLIYYRKKFHDHLPKGGNGKMFFETYENLCGVRSFIKDKVLTRVAQTDDPTGKKVIKDFLESKIRRLSATNVATGQDAATESCLFNKGYVRLVTSRNKSKNIGKWGLHSTPELYEQMGIGKISYSSFSFSADKFHVILKQ